MNDNSSWEVLVGSRTRNYLFCPVHKNVFSAIVFARLSLTRHRPQFRTCRLGILYSNTVGPPEFRARSIVLAGNIGKLLRRTWSVGAGKAFPISPYKFRIRKLISYSKNLVGAGDIRWGLDLYYLNVASITFPQICILWRAVTLRLWRRWPLSFLENLLGSPGWMRLQHPPSDSGFSYDTILARIHHTNHSRKPVVDPLLGRFIKRPRIFCRPLSNFLWSPPIQEMALQAL